MPRPVMRFVLALVASIAVFPAFAHDLNLTSLELTGRGRLTHLRLLTPLSRLVQRAGLSADPMPFQLDLAIRQRLSIWEGGVRLQPLEASIRVDSQADMVAWESDAPIEVLALSVQSRFYADDPTSRQLLAIKEEDQPRSERMLDVEHPSWNAPTSSPEQNLFFQMFLTGVRHIWSGLDHILFVVGLAFVGASLRSLIGIVTAFTVAHCATLALATVGLIHPIPRIIEPLIALSIVAIAGENLRARRTDVGHGGRKELRPWIALGFGLIHGLGFAGGLSGLDVSGAQLAGSLLSFNAGVEVGQAAILMPVFLVVLALGKHVEARRYFVLTVASVAIGLIGCFWFVERLVS